MTGDEEMVEVEEWVSMSSPSSKKTLLTVRIAGPTLNKYGDSLVPWTVEKKKTGYGSVYVQDVKHVLYGFIIE